MAQFVLPDGTISVGSAWTPATNPHLNIDEGIASQDNSRAVAASGNENNNLDIQGSNITDPAVATGHILRAQWRKQGSRTLNARLQLWQGTPGSGTLIATLSTNNIGTADQTNTYTLSASEANSITDYSALNFRLFYTYTGGGQPSSFEVDAIELETPDASADRLAHVSWAEMEVPNAPREAQLSWAEMEVPNAPREAQVSWAEMEIPTAPREAQVSWAEMELPNAPRVAQVSWAEFEVPATTREAQISWAELEVPNAPRLAQVSWAEMELPNAPRLAQVSWAELEVPNAPRLAQVSWAEMEIPTAPREAQLSWAEMETPNPPREAQVSWAEFQVPDVGGGEPYTGHHHKKHAGKGGLLQSGSPE